MEQNKLQSLLVPPELTIKEAMQKLNESAQKILFVIDGRQRLVGTVTDGDIRRAIIGGNGFSDPVAKIMYRKFAFLTRGAPALLAAAKELMIAREIEQLPVLDEDGAVRDVILWTDILEKKGADVPVSRHENRVVIMAGGKGTRMDPFTRIFPKPLIPIGKKTVVEMIMDQFHRWGFQHFILTLNYKKEYIKVFLQEAELPYRVDWIDEPEFLGTAGSLSLLKDHLRDTFVVANCDSLLDLDVAEVLAWHRDQGAIMTVIGCYHEVKIHFGVLELGEGRLRRILEKPSHDTIINTGIYVLEPRAIDYIPAGEEVHMDGLIGKMIAAGEKVSVYPIHSGWLDIGQWDQYKKAIRDYDL